MPDKHGSHKLHTSQSSFYTILKSCRGNHCSIHFVPNYLRSYKIIPLFLPNTPC